MKKVLAVLMVGLFLMVFDAKANDARHAMRKGAEPQDIDTMVNSKVATMTKELSLTGEQKEKTKVLLKEKLEKIRQLTEDYHKSLSALDREFKANLGGVLSAEQMSKWEAMRTERSGGCPDCKAGKMCDRCKKGACPDCKEGKMCPKCKSRKGKVEKDDHSQEHDHQHNE